MTFKFIIEALYFSLIIGGFAGFVYWACVRFFEKYRGGHGDD